MSESVRRALEAMREDMERKGGQFGKSSFMMPSYGSMDSVSFDTIELVSESAEQKKQKQRDKAQEALDKLEALPGMKSIKAQVEQLIHMNKIAKKRAAMGLKTESQSLHMVFTGKPGTGKTTAARLIGEAYVALELLKSHKEKIPFVEVQQADIVSMYIGEAEKNMNKKFKEARGGVLFMDEAYAFVGPHHHNMTFIANMVQQIEDMRDEVLVIVAGYPDEMEDFLNTNPGLRSRFSNVIQFSDYEVDDMVEIARLMCGDRDYDMTEGYIEAIKVRLDKERKLHGFGNARTVRNIIEQSIRRQAVRLSKFEELTKDALMYLTTADLDPTVTVPKAPREQGHHMQHVVVMSQQELKPLEPKGNLH